MCVCMNTAKFPGMSSVLDQGNISYEEVHIIILTKRDQRQNREISTTNTMYFLNVYSCTS